MPRPRLPSLPGINKLSHEYKQFLNYLRADDSQQYDIVRDRWAKLNWSLLDKCEQAISSLEKGESPNKISPLIISAGIGFDKLYSKRSEVSKPLSFPAPLLAMVRKGLKLRSPEPVAGTTAVVLPSDSLTDPREAATAPRTDPVLTQPEPTQGGVAWADPQGDGRGQGATVSRQDEQPPAISETTKSESVQTPGVQESGAGHPRVERAKALRHERKATREAMVQTVRKQIREGVPYRHPPKPGGII